MATIPQARSKRYIGERISPSVPWVASAIRISGSLAEMKREALHFISAFEVTRISAADVRVYCPARGFSSLFCGQQLSCRNGLASVGLTTGHTDQWSLGGSLVVMREAARRLFQLFLCQFLGNSFVLFFVGFLFYRFAHEHLRC